MFFNVNVPIHVEVKIVVFYFSVLIYIHVNRYIHKHEVRNNLIYFYIMRKVYLKVISGEGLVFSSEQDNSILFQRHPTSRVLSVKDMVSDTLSMLLA